MSHSQLLFPSIWNQKKLHIDIREFHNKQRLCMKKKVLMLGLDGGGKTDLFNRLICQNKKLTKPNSRSEPTIGKFLYKKKKFNYFFSFF